MIICLATSANVNMACYLDDTTETGGIMATNLDISREIENAQLGIVDENVSVEILNRIEVGCTDEDLDVVYTVKFLRNVNEIECLSDAYAADEAMGQVYAVTATTKKTTGTATEDNVDCWITMTWIDNTGPKNQIVSVSGGWTPNGRTLWDRQVLYGVVDLKGAFLDGLGAYEYPIDDSYSYTAPSNMIGLSLRAYSWVRSSGYDFSIYCNVRPTIFD